MKSRPLVSIFLAALAFIPSLRAEPQETDPPKGTPSKALLRSRGDSRPQPIFIAGTVVQESGAPPVGASIELDCRGSVTKEATVESDGRFEFQLGESNRFGQQFQDLSQEIADPFGRDSGMSPLDIGMPSITTTRVQGMPNSSSLVGCTLRAALKGYKSSVIQLDSAPLSLRNDVGTIILFPVEKVRGTTVSSASLLAPKSAKKALEKASDALRKNKVDKAEKYLKSAVTLYPNYGEAWFRLGRLYQVQNRIEEARDAYTNAIEHDNLFVRPYIQLAWILAADQKWREVASLTEQAIALDPVAFPEAYYLNAMANYNQKNLALAEKAALQVQRMDSAHRFPKIHLILASIDASRENVAGSIEQLRNYLKFGPRGTQALQESERARVLNTASNTASESRKQAAAGDEEPEVRLMLAEVLLGAGMRDQAEAEFVTYLNGRDPATMTPRVRTLSERIRERNNEELKKTPTASENTTSRPDEYADYLSNSLHDLPNFEPAIDQTPLDGILSSVGDNVSRLFANLVNISAVENVQEEKIDGNGMVGQSRRFEYLYLCLGEDVKQGFPFNEYRSDAQGQEISQLGLDEGYMLTSGFMSAPLILHPAHRRESSFRLLGYQKINGRNTILLAFAQIPEQSRLAGHFQVGTDIRRTFKQGIAWIDGENYQIIRLASDLLEPLPQVGLQKLRTQIDFGEVWFNQTTESSWFPKQVIVTVLRNGKILRNSHTYSDFRLFDVKTSLRIEKPEEVKSK